MLHVKQTGAPKARKAEPQALFPALCVAAGLPRPVPEFRFHATRKWRFDWTIADLLIALEVEGGVWTQGRHTRGAGYLKDTEKYNEAQLLGWIVLRCQPHELNTHGIALLQRAVNARMP